VSQRLCSSLPGSPFFRADYAMTLTIIELAALAVLGALVLLVLFEPGLSYRIDPPALRLDSPDFMRLVGAVSDSEIHEAERIEVLTNGSNFYPAELAAIETARVSVHVEMFILQPSRIADRFIEALTARARSGVKVRVTIDAIGSLPAPESYFAELRAAGGSVVRYQPIRWYTLKRFNNRSHRDLIIVDGNIGFIGGAGISVHWDEGDNGKAPWRDTMVRVTGSVVTGLQTCFIENWLEATGEILAGPDTFPAVSGRKRGCPALVAISAPSPARSSRARILFQLLLAAAGQSIDINSPYFLPDKSARAELMRAARRGIRLRVITPGEANNHPIARRASRRRYGELLNAGVEIYEYQPGMIHAKVLVVDGIWSVVGSTNFDSRSFHLNDEVNLAAMDDQLAKRLLDDFEKDVAASHRVTYDEWNRRPWRERVLALLGFFLERQE
jgi:cardiolipin synthase